MSFQKVRWGVLGYARIAQNWVIPAIQKSDNSVLHAVASRDEHKLRKCAEQYGSIELYKSYEELLNDPGVQAVYIPLPNGIHKEWVIKAAQKGKHVLCEKPVSVNAVECAQMIDECKKNGVKLMEAFMYRYTNRTKKVQELIESKVIGQIRHIYSAFSFVLDREEDYRWDPSQGGGALMDIGCYPVNFVGMLMGKSPVSISTQYVIKNGVDLKFSASLKYENDIIADISCGFDGFINQFSQITGTKGTITVPDTFLDNAGNIILKTKDFTEEIHVEACEKYVLEVEDFARSIIEDREPYISMDETLRNMKVMDMLLDNTYRKV
jgi:predicted dehydrogenase